MDYLSKFISYLQATKNLSDKTISAYKSDLRQFFSYEQEILQPDICSFVSHLNSQLRLKDTSIRRKIITLKCFYSYLVDIEVIKCSPFCKTQISFQTRTQTPKNHHC